MLFGDIAIDDFLPKQALKIAIAEKACGGVVKYVDEYLKNRRRDKLGPLSIEAAGCLIRVDTTSLTIVSAQRDGVEGRSRTICLANTAKHIAATILKSSAKLGIVTRKMNDSRLFSLTKKDMEWIAGETKEPLPIVMSYVSRLLQRKLLARARSGMALTDLTNKGEVPQKRKHPHKRGRAYTQDNGGVLAKIFTVDTDVIENKRSRTRLTHDESMPTANVPVHAPESTHCSRNHPDPVHFSRSPVGMESSDTVDTDVIGNERRRTRANVPAHALESTHCSRNYPDSVHLSRSPVGMELPDDSLCYSPDSDDSLHYSLESDDYSCISGSWYEKMRHAWFCLILGYLRLIIVVNLCDTQVQVPGLCRWCMKQCAFRRSRGFERGGISIHKNECGVAGGWWQVAGGRWTVQRVWHSVLNEQTSDIDAA